MSYKTILVHVDHSAHAPERMRVAAQLALEHDAHLVGAAMVGLSRFIYDDSGVDLAATVMAAQIEALGERARASLEQFEALARTLGVASYEARLVEDDAENGLALQARYADLVVLSQVDPEDPVARLMSGLPEYVLMTGARPVLIVPYAGHFAALGRHVLVAWDESREATHAIADARTLLERAGQVTLAVCNPDQASAPQPGADIALYLARHGIKVELVTQQTGSDVGNALLSLAAERQCDLLVMGGYGHARFRELLLGGVTDTLLRTMTLPVLMSH